MGPLNPGVTVKKEYWDAVVYNNATSAVWPMSITVKFSDGTVQTMENMGRFWFDQNYYGGELKYN